MKKFLLPLVMLLGSLAWGQASRLDGQVTGPTGAPVHFPTVRVCTASSTTGTVGTTNFCGTLATLYQDHLATPGGANPFTGDYAGNYHLYAAAGRVIVDIISNGVLQSETVDQIVPCEQGVTCGGAATLSGGNTNFLTVWTGPNNVAASNLKEQASTFSTTDTVDFSGATDFLVPVLPSPTPTANGHINYDNVSNTFVGGANGSTVTFFTSATSGVVRTTASATFGNFIYDFSGVSEFRPKSGLNANKPASCSASPMDVYLATDVAAGQNWFFCTALNTWTQQLNSGGGGGASTNLSNLASVAFNVALTPNAGNAGTSAADLGSASAPIDALWIGGAATNNTKITSAATAARTITIPDASGTLVLTGNQNTFTVNQTFASITSGSANPAATGFLRLANADTINFRNAANNGDINGLLIDSSNIVQVGGSAGVKFNGTLSSVSTGQAITIQPLAATGASAGGDVFIRSSGSATGSNGIIHLLPATTGTGGLGYVDIGNSAIAVSATQDASNPVSQNNLVSYTSLGTITSATPSAQSGVVGICASTNCGTASATSYVAIDGIWACAFDNSATRGDLVVVSATTAGQCHDAGTTPPASVQIVGIVTSTVSAGVYNVLVSPGGGGGSGTLPANAVINNPSSTQTIQAASAAVIPLVSECNASAGSSQLCFQVLNNAGSNLFSIANNGSITLGTGSGGSLSIGTINFAKLNSSNGTIGTSGALNLANTDSITFENAALSSSTPMLFMGSDNSLRVGTFGSAGLLSFNTANIVTFSVSNPAAPRTVTFADPGGADSVAYLSAAQTFASKTFNDQVTINGVAALAGNPSGTACSIWYNSGTGKLAATNNAGSDCTWAGAGGAASLSSLTAASGANTISNLDNAQTWKWTLTTASKSAFQFTENAAAINGAGAQFLVNINTLASSTASPFQVTARGVANGFQSDVTTGNLKLIGTAGLDLNTANAIYKEFANEGVTGTTAGKGVKLNGTNLNVIITGTGDLGNWEGICVNNCSTSGNAQVATQGFVSAVFDNATTANDCVVPSTTAGGSVHDVACSALNGEQLLGRVLSTNVGAGTYVMDLYPIQPGLAVGASNGLTVTYAGGVATFDLPQGLKTTNSPQFANVKLGGGGSVQSSSAGGSVIVQGGTNGTSTQGNLTAQGGDMTGTGANNAGSATVRGGNSASTGSTSLAGNLDLEGGQASAATGTGQQNGHITFVPTYYKGTTYTVGNLQCFQASNKVQDCGSNATNFVGVAWSSNGNSAMVAHDGSQISVNFDLVNAGDCNGTTCTVTHGDFACSGTSGKIHPQSTACTAGQTVGIIEQDASAVTSGFVTLEHF